jgi:putative MFS transporter
MPGTRCDVAGTAEASNRTGAPRAPLDAYHRRLFLFLSVATFFEGYDFLALSQLLPNLRAEFHLSEAQGGLLVAVVNAGTVVAYLLVRQADRWGRRRVLTVTILGYTLFTPLSGLAPNAAVFGLCQLAARVFLIGEWATSMVYAAEEFPAGRRGMVIGVIQAFSSLGSVVCAGVAPLLLKTAWGWRSVYFVGVLPLVVIAYLRRNLRETRRFAEQVGERAAPAPLAGILRSPYRGRVLQLAAVWALTYLCTQNAITFWKEFATGERGLTDGQVGLAITLAALVSMPMVFYSGRLLDKMGRRRGATVIFLYASLSVAGAYTLRGQWPLTLALIGGIFGASAVLPVLNAYTTELFPTELRGDAFAWSNNLLGRIADTLSPLAIGVIAESTGWGLAVGTTAIFPVLGLLLILRWFPETRGRELEDTARVGP